MLWFLLLGVICIGLPLYFYLKKRPKEAAPDYSYIIFKDYISDTIRPVSSPSTKAAEMTEEVAKETKRVETAGKQQEEAPIATLHFED